MLNRIVLSFIFSSILVSVTAQTTGDKRIDLQLKDVPLFRALQKIESLTGFRFVARAEDIENQANITIDVKDQPLDAVLTKIFSGMALTYSQTGNNIIIKKVAQKESKPRGTSPPSINRTIHGTVASAVTGESIIGASVAVSGDKIGAITNEYGFFSLTVPDATKILMVSAIGMETAVIGLDTVSVSKLNVLLNSKNESLEAVTVTAASPGSSIRSPQMSMERVTAEQLKNIPVIFGERDLMKSIQLLPGVKSAGEGNSGFYVRGGAADQNLILLDEAPVYNASHLLGFFSTFNSDAIKNVTLYKGGMPPKYGGRLSSVVDVQMNDGNNKDFDVNGGIGLIASRINIEGPLQKDKSSFIVSGRRTYADLFLKLGDSSLKSTRLYFYDLNLKANYHLGEKDKLFLSGYFGRDVLSQKDLAGINWGNSTATLRWNHIFNEKLFSNTSLIFSNYNYKIGINSEATDFQIFSQIRDWNLKEEIELYANSANTLSMGFNSIYHTIKPGEISVTGNNGTSSQGLPDRYSLENNIYAGNTWKANDKWNVAYGARLSAFSILGEGDYYNIDSAGKVTDTLHYRKSEVVKTYVNLEPRVAVSYQLNASASLKASYTRNTQNLHLISNSTSTSPTDKWVASTNIIKPGIADQFALGYYKRFENTPYELSVEGYYKAMQNQIDYRDGANVFSNEPVETQLLFGKGRAYGIEWYFKKRAGKLNGWISYTLSKTERKIDGINNGDWYNARQDRTHDIAIVGIYQLNKKWTLSATWVFYTGDAVTYPSGKYGVDGEVYFYYSERNGYRLPNYHRLDLAATVQLKQTKKFSSELVLSLFNAYGRANAYQVSFRESEDFPDKTEAVQTSLFTFVPSVTYNFKF